MRNLDAKRGSGGLFIELLQEPISKCFPLSAGFEVKKGENFDHRNTGSILRIEI